MSEKSLNNMPPSAFEFPENEVELPTLTGNTGADRVPEGKLVIDLSEEQYDVGSSEASIALAPSFSFGHTHTQTRTQTKPKVSYQDWKRAPSPRQLNQQEQLHRIQIEGRQKAQKLSSYILATLAILLFLAGLAIYSKSFGGLFEQLKAMVTQFL